MTVIETPCLEVFRVTVCMPTLVCVSVLNSCVVMLGALVTFLLMTVSILTLGLVVIVLTRFCLSLCVKVLCSLLIVCPDLCVDIV